MSLCCSRTACTDQAPGVLILMGKHGCRYDEMKSQLTNKVHYLSSPVEKGHKGWGGGFDEGTYEQFEEYVKRVDDFKVHAPARTARHSHTRPSNTVAMATGSRRPKHALGAGGQVRQGAD